MSGNSSRNKSRLRPVKRQALKNRRMRVQQRRLIGLGVPEEKVLKLNVRQLRELLRRPAELAK